MYCAIVALLSVGEAPKRTGDESGFASVLPNPSSIARGSRGKAAGSAQCEGWAGAAGRRRHVRRADVSPGANEIGISDCPGPALVGAVSRGPSAQRKRTSPRGAAPPGSGTAPDGAAPVPLNTKRAP